MRELKLEEIQNVSGGADARQPPVVVWGRRSRGLHVGNVFGFVTPNVDGVTFTQVQSDGSNPSQNDGVWGLGIGEIREMGLNAQGEMEYEIDFTQEIPGYFEHSGDPNRQDAQDQRYGQGHLGTIVTTDVQFALNSWRPDPFPCC
jgi:hypothetical protein